ncbi:TIGR03617 family F420-dependent LLM class oxidoreductase [Paraburkholderia sp. G-4-1-8]|uniref:TIGR03617 family F420-dependent LLM class oxidoreductase n=1 Tax=Paraburkholderia antibiotica TaxID=2728839 RepID=A0A7X9X898_9BURK|nr:TIGR03617 family F420-dependent LLM class oxidoreductase [Paraburkholderia antibiotica]
MALENQHNPYLPLAAAALVTNKIQLGTAVAMAFPRAPVITAMEAWDIHAASNGRMFLGLGPQVKPHNERRYGIAWSEPAPRLRDYVDATRAIWRCWENGGGADPTEPLNFKSETYNLSLMTPNFSPEPTGLNMPPIAISAIGPKMLTLAAERCDGVRLHPFSSRQYLEEVSNRILNDSFAATGRDRSNFELVTGGFIATGPTKEAMLEMREYVRFRIAFYCSTKAYANVHAMHGLEELREKLVPYARAGRWDEMAACIPDELIDIFAVCGTYDTIAEQLEDHYSGLGDTIYLPTHNNCPIPDDKLARVVEKLQAIPMKFKGYRNGTDWTTKPEPLPQRGAPEAPAA